MSIQTATLTWEQLLELAQSHTAARRVRRPGQLPSTVPIPSSLSQLPPGTSPPVVFYRDANSWCPFCERVWFALEEKKIPFSTEFIDLNHKPKWYTDLVPSGLVPAIEISDTIVCESKDILLALESQFQDSPLLPIDPEENSVAYQMIEDAETNGAKELGYKFMMGMSDDSTGAQAAFEAKLDDLEQALANYPGSYFLSTFSLVDILYAPHLDRLAAGLPVYRNYHIKGNPRFPNLNAWFATLDQRSAFQRVKTDATTFNLVLRRIWGIESIAPPLPIDSMESEVMHYRAEAAERLSDNREAAIADIFKNSGVQALEGDAPIVKNAIEAHLKLLAAYLLDRNTLLPWGRVGGKENFDSVAAAVGAITLAYVRNRICAPRDMSAGAATAFRSSVDHLLTAIY
ncbi:glutathione S-transferase family protein [Leptolyngbya sp. NIES-2104]|uniref:glutathione S-transferase family protein n=1 Tax=Leptolyngbya sp. NIES-2104 TaxID=1552121 RepID=UPI0006EC6E20|nr:glutathione S-transferase family protein [Leptolyngbya sp. NIES-2104]GAP99796.1 glutathione S-transferase-like [Leptolyngbya sp. NIES-2104]